MSPFDARHGTYAGAVAHWRAGERPCLACRPIAARRRKLNRLRVAEGRPNLVPATGTVRRIRALQAIGYSVPAIAHECGVAEKSLRNPGYRGTAVYRSTAEKVAAAYERLCMTPPEGGYAHRARLAAARKGYAPPLAWDDIDDPAETPTGWHYIAPDRADALHDMDALHIGVTEACVRLDVRRDNLERWCARRGMGDLYSRLVDRDTPRYWRNGVAEGGAA